MILYSESYRSLRSAYITDLAKFTINRKSQVNVKGGYDKRYRLRDIAFHFFAVLLLHRAPIAVQLFWMLVVLIAAPIILFWTLTRREWPDYSRMLFTLGWGWSSFAVIRSVLYHRRVKYAVIKSFKMTYGLAVVLYTLAFPGLIINFGDISQTEAWNPKYRLSIPFVVWPVIAILLYLIWDWL